MYSDVFSTYLLCITNKLFFMYLVLIPIHLQEIHFGQSRSGQFSLGLQTLSFTQVLFKGSQLFLHKKKQMGEFRELGC